MAEILVRARLLAGSFCFHKEEAGTRKEEESVRESSTAWGLAFDHVGTEAVRFSDDGTLDRTFEGVFRCVHSLMPFILPCKALVDAC